MKLVDCAKGVPSFAKEGWLRHKENGPVPQRRRRGGCSKPPLTWPATVSCSLKQPFLYRCALSGLRASRARPLLKECFAPFSLGRVHPSFAKEGYRFIRYRPVVFLFWLVLSNVFCIAGQLPPATFEVASIKPSGSTANANFAGDCQGKDSNPRSRYKPGLGRCVFRGATLKELISAAYSPVSFGGRLGFPMDRIEKVDGLGWVESERFDVEAKVDDAANITEEQLYMMLRHLLVERFKLKLRHSTREVSGYTLEVTASGSKLRPATGLETRSIIGGGPPSGGFMAGEAVPVSAIVTFVSGRLGRPIEDRTGLTGRYSWELKWAPDENEVRPDGAPAPRSTPDAGPSLITAVREQLGLKLQSAKVKVAVLYIDHAEKPKPN